MYKPLAVQIPLLNPNETEIRLVEVHVAEAAFVRKGDLLVTLETTKSAGDLLAETDGFVRGLAHQPGEVLKAGDVFCYLTRSVDDPLPAMGVKTAAGAEGDGMPAGLRITQKARELALASGVDLERLPADRLVTEAVVRQFIPRAEQADEWLKEIMPGSDAVLIYGAGGHGKSILELVQAAGKFRAAGFLDDGLAPGSQVMGVRVLGGAGLLPELRRRGFSKVINAVGGIGNISTRLAVFQRLREAGFEFPTVVHPGAWVEPSAILNEGVQVFCHAYVGSDVRVAFGCIINTGAILSHDCILGEASNISPGAILAGAVHVGARVLVGMGVTANLDVHIGDDARIGNGATVKSDVPEQGIVHAGAIWPEPWAGNR